MALSLLDRVLTADPTKLSAGKPKRLALDALLAGLIDQMPGVDQALHARYLTHTELPKQFTAIEPTLPTPDSTGKGGQP